MTVFAELFWSVVLFASGFLMGVAFCQRLVERAGDCLRQAQRKLREVTVVQEKIEALQRKYDDIFERG
jgi:hypothetical protein